MKTTRREFLWNSILAAAAGGLPGALAAAMKYDRDGVLRLFRLMAEEIDARVKAGIELNRKGPMLFTFTDAAGKVLENVRLKVTQKTHDFKYGADLFMLDEIVDSKEKNEAYKEHFRNAFNLATCPFYWLDLEPKQGKPRYAPDSPRIYRRPPTDLCVDWCEKNGIEPKCHILNYPAFQPQWAKGDIYLEKRLLEKRMRELAERYAQRIRMWEVTNETLWGANWRNGNFYQQDDFVEWSFRTAEKYFGSNELIINEAHSRIWNDDSFLRNRSSYYMQIERALLKGVRIDGVGLQFHMFHGADMANVVRQAKSFYDPMRVFDVLDTYARLGRPLQITEITIPAYSEDPGDEETQAEILRTLYRIWFSHRAMKAIIYWNLPDGYAAFAKPGDFSGGENLYYGGLCRFDMTPKPAYRVIQNLFGKEWRTAFTRDVGGVFSFRGFHGEYELEATANGKTVRETFRLNPDFTDRMTVRI